MDPAWDLRRHAAMAPHRVAVDDGERRWSYAELEALANRSADAWRRLGLRRGDHVASLVDNRAEALALAWAAWRTGVYLTPMSTTLTPSELHYLVTDCDARLLIVSTTLRATAEALAEVLPSSILRSAIGGPIRGYSSFDALLTKASPRPVLDEPPGALMMYTSGTTGAPKGMVRPLLPVDWRGTPPFAADLIALFDLAGEDVRYLSTAPLYHAAPLRFALAVTAGGGTVHLMPRFDADDALRRVEREAITHSQWVPAMFQRLLALPAARRAAFRAPAHRCAIHGAAPCTPALKRSMIEWWGPILIEYYSGSEGVGLTIIDSTEALVRPGSVGRARKGELHIIDNTGCELPVGATGLVCFSGVTPFEYYKAPEKTAARTLPGGLQTFGDLGHVDADGYLYLTDRLDDVIISGGVNVYPQEIEAVIRGVPGVWDCAVVGVADELFGERPVAFVVARNGASPGEVVAEVQRRCLQHLGRVKRPNAIRLVDALPRSAAGKLLRRRLRDTSFLNPTSTTKA